MRKRVLLVAVVLMCISAVSLFAQEKSTKTQSETTVTEQSAQKPSGGIRYIAAALAVGIACIAGGMAVGKIGAAAMGAMAENAELSGKALPFVGLAEGICLWGFLVGLLIVIM